MKRILITALVCAVIVTTLTVLSVFDFGYRELIYTLVSIGLFVFGSIFLKLLTPKVRAIRFFKFFPLQKGDFSVLLSMTFLVISGGFLFNLLTIWLLGFFGVAVPAGEYTWMSTDSLWLSIMTIAVVPAISEEIFFRGAVLAALSKEKTVAAVLVSSLFFAIVHGTWYYFLSNFYAGIVFAIMIYVTNSIFVSMTAHFINNIMSVMLFVYSNRLTVVGLDSVMIWLLIFVFLVSLYFAVGACAKRLSVNVKSEKPIINEGELLWLKEQEKKQARDK